MFLIYIDILKRFRKVITNFIQLNMNPNLLNTLIIKNKVKKLKFYALLYILRRRVNYLYFVLLFIFTHFI